VELSHLKLPPSFAAVIAPRRLFVLYDQPQRKALRTLRIF